MAIALVHYRGPPLCGLYLRRSGEVEAEILVFDKLVTLQHEEDGRNRLTSSREQQRRSYAAMFCREMSGLQIQFCVYSNPHSPSETYDLLWKEQLWFIKVRLPT